MVKVQAVETDGITASLDRAVDSPLWDRVHRTCLGCGVCTYLCPTCHCFVISDTKRGARGERVRCWDACQYPAFTLEASGHNPRPTPRERLRHRMLHKFSYFPKDFGKHACVGCGRCVEHCPVNLDLREVIAAVRGEAG